MLVNLKDNIILIIESIDKLTTPFGASVIFFVIIVVIICALVFAAMLIYAIVKVGLFKVSEIRYSKSRTRGKNRGRKNDRNLSWAKSKLYCQNKKL